MADEKIAIDDIVEAAARGALRALDARRTGDRAAGNTLELVRSGFVVDILIRCGGIPGPGSVLSRQDLNPQPLPP
jgi:hypothetical protein